MKSTNASWLYGSDEACIGISVPIDGSGDHRINIKGLDGYTVEEDEWLFVLADSDSNNMTKKQETSI